jgi:hypothetical protein
VRQFGVRYAFVREVSMETYEGAGPYHWDIDGTITVAYKLSRLIWDDGISTEYAARVVEHEDGEKQVIPGPVHGETATAYRAHADRDWLDAGQAAELRELLTAYWANPGLFTGRLDRAMFRCEESAHHRYAQTAVAEIVTGVEALVKTSRHESTKQFTHRVPALARELGFVGVTKRLCEQLYRWRSQSAHGAHVTMLSGRPQESGPAGTPQQEQALAKIARSQDVLRGALRRVVLDPIFARTLKSAAEVRRRWPVAGRGGNPL